MSDPSDARSLDRDRGPGPGSDARSLDHDTDTDTCSMDRGPSSDVLDRLMSKEKLLDINDIAGSKARLKQRLSDYQYLQKSLDKNISHIKMFLDIIKVLTTIDMPCNVDVARGACDTPGGKQ